MRGVRKGSGREGPAAVPHHPFSKEEVDAEGLFRIVGEFLDQQRSHHAQLAVMETCIWDAYERFTPAERVKFFSILYDRFSERYDTHMGEQTGHYAAIERLLWFAAPRLEFPMLDITAGTGEPLSYALHITKAGLHGFPDQRWRPPLPPEPDGAVFANEISGKMLGTAKRKLRSLPDEAFMNGSAYDVPLEGMATVLCSQTFHLIPDEDKMRLVQAIHRSLRKGGTAIVMEEDPFRISPTPSIEEVSMFLRAVVKPIKHRGKLQGLFATNGFVNLEERAAFPIDPHHIMRLHLFQKI